MARRSRRAAIAREKVVLAAIARRDWLLGVLAASAAACRGDRRSTRPDSRITILYPVDERAVGPYYQMPSQFREILGRLALLGSHQSLSRKINMRIIRGAPAGSWAGPPRRAMGAFGSLGRMDVPTSVPA